MYSGWPASAASAPSLATLGSQRLVYDPLHCLVVSVTMLPQAHVVEASPEAPYLCARLNVDLGELAALLLAAGPAVSRHLPA